MPRRKAASLGSPALLPAGGGIPDTGAAWSGMGRGWVRNNAVVSLCAFALAVSGCSDDAGGNGAAGGDGELGGQTGSGGAGGLTGGAGGGGIGGQAGIGGAGVGGSGVGGQAGLGGFGGDPGVPGCTDPDAKNPTPDANTDDGSCTYDLTFEVSMACPDAVDGDDRPLGELNGFTDVAITGPVFGFAPNVVMTAEGDGSYSITLEDLNLGEPSFEYLYLTDNYFSKERLWDEVGRCSIELNDPDPVIANRVIDPVHGATYVDVFGQCGACPMTDAELTWSMGDPVDTDAPDLPPISHPLRPNATWDALSAPLPTNAWWMNAGLNAGVSSVNVWPYVVRTFDNRLEVAPGDRLLRPTGVDAIFLVYQTDLAFTATEPFETRQIVDHDLLSVTVEWTASTSGSMRAPLVRGSPFITMIYDGLTPVLRAGSANVTDLTGSGSRYEVTLDNGNTWIIYASAPITLTRIGNEVRADAPFDGFLRIARQNATASSVLDAHSGAVPVGGDVDAGIDAGTAEVTFTWERTGTGPLLMMAMPHHQDTLAGASVTTLTERTIRGNLAGITGDTWTLRWTLPAMGFQAERPIDPGFIADITTALAAEKGARPTAPDTYFFGTQIGRMSRLILIAEELDDGATGAEITDNLRADLAPWIAGDNVDPLVYDTVWGGVVPEDAAFNPSQQFGSGYYNDHHFHYGYHVYAAAVIAKRDPAWIAANGDWYRTLIRDFVNPSESDSFFPRFRAFDWWVGHSWAAGLFEFVDGRNQESVSESIHAYYAVKLFGEATGDDNLRGLGWLLASMETNAGRTYWQVKNPSTIYEQGFETLGTVGILWSLKAEHNTFFGNNVEFIFGIQFLPITPASEALLDPVWAASVWPRLSTALTRPAPALEPDWQLLIAALRGTHDVADARTLVVNPNGLGRSRTNILWWLGTRP